MSHLVVNPEVYALTFVTGDNMKFEIIKNNVGRLISNSKLRVSHSKNQDFLFVDKAYYKQVIDFGIEYLHNNNLEDFVYWSNIDENLIKCGYYCIAVAISEDKIADEKIKEYSNVLKDELKTDVDIMFQNGKYFICLKGIYYEELHFKFNNFILQYGVEPFQKIENMSRYGELDKKYPVLSKRNN